MKMCVIVCLFIVVEGKKRIKKVLNFKMGVGIRVCFPLTN